MASSLWIDIWKTRPDDAATVWIRKSGHTPIKATFRAATETVNAHFFLLDDGNTILTWFQIDQWHTV
ncbi:MAG: hypothetical protein ACXWKH_11125 [Limisphaerales bacterium]